MARKKHVKSDLLPFLREHGKDRTLITRAWKTISLYKAIGQARRYPLVPAEKLRSGDYIDAIRGGLLTVVDTVRFVPVSIGITEADLRKAENYVVHPARSLTANRRGDIEEAFDEEAVMGLSDLFWAEVATPVIAAFIKSHSDFLLTLDEDLRSYVTAVSSMGLFYFLLYALKGDAEKVAEMEPFLSLSTKAIPMGEPWAEMGTWIVLTA